MTVELSRLEPAPAHLVAMVTNRDGRPREPLLSDAIFTPGRDELRFHLGAYCRESGPITDPP